MAESQQDAAARRLRDTSRLEAFSDGVIAIAITLLVLEVHVPDPGDVTSERALWHALGQLWPSYVGYLISFITIGIMWANHHRIFTMIGQYDHNLIVLNLLLLLCIGFIPFTTDLLAEYLGEPGEQTAAIVYAGWFFVTAIIYNVLWRYLRHKPILFMPEVDKTVVLTITQRFNFGPPAYLISFVLAFFSVEASLGLQAFLAVLYLLPIGRDQ
ncbi:MAG: TMEM175 family protein [Thermomicrobiales bacterium]